ncbi:NAD(P)/FAD-dependent oxidoreductase [Halobacterium bonnevillei]|uniref:FAD-dependent oxidoreductase n=1 Tax=Halobacterium bonnevillei TaxID=2692200 RepID=A0A6B0SLH7_9EURY|nr:NAD(P)/FAD-dependent oxidoreductase [Halobacterium bonnevillei]MXR22117.1 FAD-dependent oxidoreductase [Halobacterium bonnevillei]
MIAIVGGGIAGLAAARRLQGHGYDVRVFEASSQVGGLAATTETAGDPIEQFYHHLSASEETIVDLLEDLGLGDDLEWPIGKNAYYVDGTVYPMDKPWEILAFPHWSLYDKFRLGMLTLDVDVRGGIPRFDTYDDLADFEDVPVKQFCIEHTTRNVYETFFEPLLEAKFGERMDDVSAAWLLGRIKFRGERDLLRGEPLGYLDGGFGRLLDRLVEDVGRENIETDTRVTDVGTENAELRDVTVEHAAEADGGEMASGFTSVETYDADAVVVAAMPNVLESLTGYECDITFQGTVCSVVSMDESLTDTYWLNIADDAPFGALIEHTNFVPPERYGGEHLLYVPKYVQSADDPVWQMSDREVADHWLDGIAALFPEFDRSQVNWVETARNPRTAPVYERGYLDMVIPYHLDDDVADGVYYAGMASRAQYPERSLNGGIVAGYECADRIVGEK